MKNLCKLKYLSEYFDYFLQKYPYNGKRNIYEYNKIYKNKFNDQYVKNIKFQKHLKDKIYYGNQIHKNFNENKIQIILKKY